MLKFRSLSYISTLAAAIIAATSVSVRAQEAPPADPPVPEGQVVMHETFDTPGDGRPEGWSWRGGGTGEVDVVESGGETFLRLSAQDGDTSYVQHNIELPEDAHRVDFDVRYRYDGIEPGESGYQRGKVQGRFLRNGDDDFGSWIEMGNLSGSSDGWVDVSRGANVPEDATGVMLRVSLYDVQAGTLDVASARARVMTRQQLADYRSAQRAQYRPAEPYGEPVPQARIDRLARGVNINNWFGQPYNGNIRGTRGGFRPDHLEGFITDEDLSAIRAAGFLHIRLPLEPAYLMDGSTGALDPEAFAHVDRAIERIIDHDLAVIIDAHPKMRGTWFRNLDDNPDAMNRFVRWWSEVAAHLADTTDPDMVYLELLNEPGGQGFYNQKWDDYQDRLIMAVREQAPEHTLLANDGGWQLVHETVEHEPHPDRNVIYVVHYYNPSQFTHQGATWMSRWYRPLREIPWPLTEDNLDEALAGIDQDHENADAAARAIRGAVSQGIGTPEKITRDMAQLREWADSVDRPVIINEFGVYTRYGDPASRLRWLDHITDAMAEHDIGWSHWDYQGDFGFATGEPGEREMDSAILEALMD